MKANSIVKIGRAEFGNALPFSILAGPCQLETRQHAFDMAGGLLEICNELGIGLVYKSSFDKANRTSLSSKRGSGLDAAMPIFDDLRKKMGLAIVTDVHTEQQCAL